MFKTYLKQDLIYGRNQRIETESRFTGMSDEGHNEGTGEGTGEGRNW